MTRAASNETEPFKRSRSCPIWLLTKNEGRPEAAQCIAARGQAEDLLRLLRQHAGDINLVMRLNAQYGSMVRTSLSVHGRLMRVQAVRRKREATGSTENADAWTQHVAERSMLAVVDPDSKLPDPAWPNVAPVAAPAASVNQRVADSVSENGTKSQHAAFETSLSAEPRTAPGSEEADLRSAVRQAMSQSHSAKSRSAGRKSPANGGKSPARTDYGHRIDGKTAPT